MSTIIVAVLILATFYAAGLFIGFQEGRRREIKRQYEFLQVGLMVLGAMRDAEVGDVVRFEAECVSATHYDMKAVTP